MKFIREMLIFENYTSVLKVLLTMVKLKWYFSFTHDGEILVIYIIAKSAYPDHRAARVAL